MNSRLRELVVLVLGQGDCCELSVCVTPFFIRINMSWTSGQPFMLSVVFKYKYVTSKFLVLIYVFNEIIELLKKILSVPFSPTPGWIGYGYLQSTWLSECVQWKTLLWLIRHLLQCVLFPKALWQELSVRNILRLDSWSWRPDLRSPNPLPFSLFLGEIRCHVLWMWGNCGSWSLVCINI